MLAYLNKKIFVFFFILVFFLPLFSQTDEQKVMAKIDSVMQKLAKNLFQPFDSILIMGKVSLKLKDGMVRKEVEIIFNTGKKNFSVKTDKEGFFSFLLPSEDGALRWKGIRYDTVIYPFPFSITDFPNTFLKINILTGEIGTEDFTLNLSENFAEILEYFVKNYPENKYVESAREYLSYMPLVRKVESLTLAGKFEEARDICTEQMVLNPESELLPFVMTHLAVKHINFLNTSNKEKIGEEMAKYVEIANTTGNAGSMFLVLLITGLSEGFYFFTTSFPAELVNFNIDDDMKLVVMSEILRPYLTEKEFLEFKFYTYYEAGDYNNALKTLKSLLKKGVKIEDEKIFSLIDHFYREEDYRKVISIFDNLNYSIFLEKDAPHYIEYYVNSLIKLGKDKEAKNYAKKIISETFKNKNISKNTAYAIFKLAIIFDYKNYADKIYQNILSRFSDDYVLSLTQNAVRTYKEMGREKDGLFFVKRFLKEDSTRWYLWKIMGDIYYDAGKYDSSQIFYEKTLKFLDLSKERIEESFYRVYLFQITRSLCDIYMKKGNVKKAVPILKDFLEKYPDYKETFKKHLEREGYKSLINEVFEN